MPAFGRLVAAQSWKLRLSFVLLAIGGVCNFAAQPIARVIGVDPGLLLVFGVLLSIVALTFAAMSVRCPSCGLRLFWFAVSKKSVGAWLSWLLQLESCPRCHYPAGTERDGVA